MSRRQVNENKCYERKVVPTLEEPQCGRSDHGRQCVGSLKKSYARTKRHAIWVAKYLPIASTAIHRHSAAIDLPPRENCDFLSNRKYNFLSTVRCTKLSIVYKGSIWRF